MKKSESKFKTSSSETAGCSEGAVIVVSAPSGCGKTTVVDRLVMRHPDWVRSISVTTRSPRMGEKEGKDYFFVSSEVFGQMAARGEFLESAEVFGERYGTPREFVFDALKENRKVLLTVDIQGAQKVKAVLEGQVPLLSIFILPPSVKALRERLENRKTDSRDQIHQRIEAAQAEIKVASRYDSTVVNQNLDQTIAEFEELVENYLRKRGASHPLPPREMK